MTNPNVPYRFQDHDLAAKMQLRNGKESCDQHVSLFSKFDDHLIANLLSFLDLETQFALYFATTTQRTQLNRLARCMNPLHPFIKYEENQYIPIGIIPVKELIPRVHENEEICVQLLKEPHIYDSENIKCFQYILKTLQSKSMVPHRRITTHLFEKDNLQMAESYFNSWTTYDFLNFAEKHYTAISFSGLWLNCKVLNYFLTTYSSHIKNWRNVRQFLFMYAGIEAKKTLIRTGLIPYVNRSVIIQAIKHLKSVKHHMDRLYKYTQLLEAWRFLTTFHIQYSELYDDVFSVNNAEKMMLLIYINDNQLFETVVPNINILSLKYFDPFLLAMNLNIGSPRVTRRWIRLTGPPVYSVPYSAQDHPQFHSG